MLIKGKFPIQILFAFTKAFTRKFQEQAKKFCLPNSAVFLHTYIQKPKDFEFVFNVTIFLYIHNLYIKTDIAVVKICCQFPTGY